MRYVYQTLFLFLACSPSLGIQGGSPILEGSPDELRSSVRMINGGLCTASRISRLSYLTAAHCVSDLSLSPGAVIKVEATGVPVLLDVLVTEVFVHPKYGLKPVHSEAFLNNSYDVAIVNLEFYQEVGNGQAAVTSPLPKKTVPIVAVDNASPAPGDKLSVTGGGCTLYENNACAQPVSQGDPIKFMETEQLSSGAFGFLSSDLYFRIAVSELMRLLPGDSGGGVFNTSGNLVGVSSFMVHGPPGVTYPVAQYQLDVTRQEVRSWILQNQNKDLNFENTKWVSEKDNAISTTRLVIQFAEENQMTYQLETKENSGELSSIKCEGTYVRGLPQSDEFESYNGAIAPDMQCTYSDSGGSHQFHTSDPGQQLTFSGLLYRWEGPSKNIVLFEFKKF